MRKTVRDILGNLMFGHTVLQLGARWPLLLELTGLLFVSSEVWSHKEGKKLRDNDRASPQQLGGT